MSESRATVFVIDDDASVRRSLRKLLTAAALPVETFASSKEFLDVVHAERHGCLLQVVRLKEENGLALQNELRRRNVRLPIIVLTGQGEVPTPVRALKAGAFDFLQKPTPPAVLLERVQAAIAVDRIARAMMSSRADAAARLSSLTPREHEVMSLLVAGVSQEEVAADLKTSVGTVEKHRRRVLTKLHVSSNEQLIRVVAHARGSSTGN